MPILSEEPNLYPESLLDPDGITQSNLLSDRQWWMLVTRPKQEKAVARILWKRKLPFYLPLLRREAVYSHCRVTVSTPLFPSYVFLFGSDEERILALTSNRIAQTCKMEDAQQAGRELWQIQRLIDSVAELSVESRMVPGERVRVKQGPLAGLEGTVLDRAGQTRLCLAMKSLPQGVSLQIDDKLLLEAV